MASDYPQSIDASVINHVAFIPSPGSPSPLCVGTQDLHRARTYISVACPPLVTQLQSSSVPSNVSKPPSSQSLQEQIIQGATMKLRKRDSLGSITPEQKQTKKPLLRATGDTPQGEYSYYVREGQKSEINAIADVLMDSFHSESRPAFDSYIRRFKYNHLQMCFGAEEENDRGLFVACAIPVSSLSTDEEQIVGFCSVDGRPPDTSCKLEFLTPYTLACTSPRPYLSDLGVSTSHRRRGIGEKLVRACEEWTHKRGYEKLYLKVEDKNVGGVALYSALGYTKTKLPWGKNVASTAGLDATVLMEKPVKEAKKRDKRKRSWIKNQLWKPMKERVNRYSSGANDDTPL